MRRNAVHLLFSIAALLTGERTSAAADPTAQLLSQATQKFGQGEPKTLTRAEVAFFRAAALGNVADYSVTFPPIGLFAPFSALGMVAEFSFNDPATSAKWSKERVLQADRIAWLCMDRDARNLVTAQGIRIKGARIEGQLSLALTKVSFPLIFEQCALSETLDLQNAVLSSLYLPGTHTGVIGAWGCKVEGSVFLRNGFKSTGGVILTDAAIGQSLDCSGGGFFNKGGAALDGDRLKVGGSAFLRNGFQAEGSVYLSAASIGQNLECDNSQFLNSDGDTAALSLENVKVAASVFMRNARVIGETYLYGANIGQNLDCSGAKLRNVNKTALQASGAKIGAFVFLGDGFRAEGEVNMQSADIGKALECSGGQFVNPGKFAFNAAELKVESSLFLGTMKSYDGSVKKFEATGQVNLILATVGGNLDCVGGIFLNPAGIALEADSIKIGGSVNCTEDFKAQGEVHFSAAAIAKNFNWIKVASSQDVTVLDLGSANIGTLRFGAKENWPQLFFLNGLTYGAIVDMAEDRDASDSKSKKQFAVEVLSEWLARQGKPDFYPKLYTQPYEQLAAVLRKSGRDDDARQILIEKNNLVSEPTALSAFFHWVFGVTCRYGYDPLRAIYFSFGFILLGWLLFWWGYRHGLMKPEQDSADQSPDYPTFHAFAYSIETFTPVLNLCLAKYWLPSPRRGGVFRWGMTSGSLLRCYLWIHILMGWALTTLWVGGLVGLIQK